MGYTFLDMSRFFIAIALAVKCAHDKVLGDSQYLKKV